MSKRHGIYLLTSIIVLIIFVGTASFFYFWNEISNSADQEPGKTSQPPEQTDTTPNSDIDNNSAKSNDVSWNFDFDSNEWQVKGNPPKCLDPLVFPAPADVSLASGLLYPGQVRGGDYKPHGGFRFDYLESNEIDVYAPIEGNLYRAAKHPEPESGEIQYSLYFINDCGIMYKLDHLRELTLKFEEILDTVPMGGVGDSRSTEIKPPVFVTRGEHIATKVGIENYPSGHEGKNIFFDFGVYDLRETNGVNYDSEFRAQHPNIDEFGTHGICWFDYLEEPDKSIVQNLSAGGAEGEESDYCDLS